MVGLFFRDAVSTITTGLVLALVVFLVWVAAHGRTVTQWGRYILVAVVVGTALSALSATRDAFMAPGALFTLTDVQTLLCAAAGGVIYLLGLTALLVRRQSWRKAVFHSVGVLLVVQIAAVEGTRIAMAAGLAL